MPRYIASLARCSLACLLLLWNIHHVDGYLNNNDFNFTIIFHSNLDAGIEPSTLNATDCQLNGTPQACKVEGGYPLVKSTVNKITLDRPGQPILNLNVNNGLATKLITRYYKGTAEKELLGQLGVVASGVGNHEMISNVTSLALNFYTNATFQGLSSNMLARVDHPLSKTVAPYYVHSFVSTITNATIRVGVMSLIGADVCSRTFFCTQYDVELVRFRPIKSTIMDIVERLQFHEEVDVIIALSGSDDLNQDIALLQSVDGIDILLSSDGVLQTTNNATLVNNVNILPFPVTVVTPSGRTAIAANVLGKSGKNTGVLDVSFVNGILDSAKGHPIYNTNATGKIPDASMQAAMQPYLDYLNLQKQLVAGSTTVKLDNTVCTSGECVAADVLTDAIFWGMPDACDYVIVNAGSMQASIEAGSITVAGIGLMFPLSNTVSTFTIQGRYLVDALNNGVSRAGVPKGGRFPAVKNIKFGFDINKKSVLVNPFYTDYPNYDFRITRVEMKVPGNNTYEPLDLDAEYRMCAIDYITQGGDGYQFNKYGSQIYVAGPQLDDVYQKYVEANSPLNPAPDGRVTIEAYPKTGGITGTCKYPTVTIKNSTGVYEDICGGGLRAVSSFTWMIAPVTDTVVRALTLSFDDDFQLEDDGSDTVILTEKGRTTPLLVRINGTDIPAVFTGDENPLPNGNLTFFASAINVSYTATAKKSGPGLKVAFWSSQNCPPGYDDEEVDGVLSCSSCAPGYYGFLGSCHLCGPGSYADKNASVACTPCDEDSFTKSTGATHCDLCDGERTRVSATECNCPSGFYYNGFSCLDGRGSSDSAIVAGIAAVVLVLFGGVGYWYYRRRMRLIQERATKNTKTTTVRVEGGTSLSFIFDTVSTLVWICLDCLEVVFDWLAFVNLGDEAGLSRFVYVAVVIIGCIGSVISMGIRIYFLNQFFQLYFYGINFIEKKKSKSSKTSVTDENDNKLRELHESKAFKDAMMELRLARRKLSLTQFVAMPGIFKGVPVMVTEIYLFTVLGSQGMDVGILLISFVFTTAMLALNMSEVSHWPEARKSVRDAKGVADAILQNANMARASAFQLDAPSHSGLKIDAPPPVPKIGNITASAHLGGNEHGKTGSISNHSLAPSSITSEKSGLKSPAELAKSKEESEKSATSPSGRRAEHVDNAI